MIQHARRAVLLVDESKFDRRALSAIASLGDVDLILAAGVADRVLRRLKQSGIDVRSV
jgi:DeoR/GlpR family transcriptional regulator of sugar metabolism